MVKSRKDDGALLEDELRSALDMVMPSYLAGYANSPGPRHPRRVRVSSAEIADALAGTLLQHPCVPIFVTRYMLKAGYSLESVDGEMKWTLYAADGEPG